MRTIQEILTDLATLAKENADFNRIGMKICQKFGYNGMKRMHRCKTKMYYNILLCLENKAYDYYELDIKENVSNINYNPASIIDHFKMWLSATESDLKQLNMLNKEFIELTGFYAPKTDCMLEDLLKTIEKCKRVIKRYDEIGTAGTALHDLHRQDTDWHKKYKEYEEKHYAQ